MKTNYYREFLVWTLNQPAAADWGMAAEAGVISLVDALAIDILMPMGLV